MSVLSYNIKILMVDVRRKDALVNGQMVRSASAHRSDADADRQGQGERDIILITLHLLSAAAHGASVVILCSLSGTYRAHSPSNIYLSIEPLSFQTFLSSTKPIAAPSAPALPSKVDSSQAPYHTADHRPQISALHKYRR